TWAARPLPTKQAPRPVGGPSASVDLGELDSEPLRVLEDALVAIELAEDDPDAAGVGDELEAGPARRGGGVDGGAVDGDPVLGRLDDGVGLRVHGGDAMTVFHHVPLVVAVGQAPEGAVVTGGEHGAIADDHRAHV